MATMKENITNALSWFYDRLKKNDLDPIQEEIDELNSNITDMVVWSQTQSTSTVSIAANTGVDVTNYGVSRPSTPSGYTRLYNVAFASGAPEVVSVGIGSPYVMNTASSSHSVTLYYGSLFVRNIS